MKKINIFRLTATLALFFTAGLGAYAQYVGPTSTYDAVTTTSDYVTIGSRVPYYVAPDATIAALAPVSMDYSEFNWEVLTSALAPLAITPETYAGAALTVGEGLAPWVKENEISVTWAAPTAAAGTQYVLRATEHSNPLGALNFDFGCADATPEVRNVFVLAAPTVAFDGTEGGGCTVAPGTTFYVPLNITGLGDWEVSYTVAYNGGAVVASATPYTLLLAAPAVTDVNVIAESIAARDADGTSSATPATDGLAIDLPATQYGYYDVAITGFTDRISRKSMDAMTAVTAAGTYRIYVNPTPVTSPIQHLENL